MRWTFLLALSALGFVAFVGRAGHATTQSLPTITIPGSTTVPPGGSVTFRSPPPFESATLRVTNDSPVSATVTHNGSTLIITVPTEYAVRITEVVELPMPLPCSREGAPPNDIRCNVQPASFGPGVTFTTDRIAPPTPTPTPAPQTVTIPGSATVGPGRSVIFRRPADGATLTVSYGGREPATVTYDGAVLTVTAPPLGTGQSLSGTVPGRDAGATCTPVDNQRNVLRCTVQPTVDGTEVLIGILIADPPPTPGGTETVELFAACNNVSLTWPNGTPTGAVARAITPPSALVAIWRYDNATQRFQAFSPQFPQASDLLTVNRLDAVFICMSGPGTLSRPAA